MKSNFDCLKNNVYLSLTKQVTETDKMSQIVCMSNYIPYVYIAVITYPCL